MFCIGSTQKLYDLMDALSHNEFNLIFTMQYHERSISILDIQIIIQETGLTETTLFCKSNSGNTILHAGSVHPKPLVSSIPYNQYLGLKRICSSEAHFKQEANALRNRLLARGYSRTMLRKADNRACNRTRKDLLFNSKKKTQSDSVRIIIHIIIPILYLLYYTRRHSCLRTNDSI